MSKIKEYYHEEICEGQGMNNDDLDYQYGLKKQELESEEKEEKSESEIAE